MIGGEDSRRRSVGHRRGHDSHPGCRRGLGSFFIDADLCLVNGRRGPEIAAACHAGKVGSALLKRQLHS